jgi:hypothetical protein
LQAYDAANLSIELDNSAQVPGDTAGNAGLANSKPLTGTQANVPSRPVYSLD